MSKVVPEVPPFRTEGEELEEPSASDLRIALLRGGFSDGAYCLGLMREETIFAAGLGYATTHALLATRTALLDNEDTADCMALWAMCRVRALQQLAREWEDSDGEQGLRAFTAASEFVRAVRDEADRLPAVLPEPEAGVWSIAANEREETEPMRELQGHLVRIASLVGRLRNIRARAIVELCELSLGKREAISSELGSAIESVRSLDETPRCAVIQSIFDAASEWEKTGANASRNRALCDGAAVGLSEALGRTDTAEWNDRFYEAARAYANTPKFGSWYIAALALMEALGLEESGASLDKKRSDNLAKRVSEWRAQGRLTVIQRTG